jgi:hypothetical protein
LTLNLTPAAKLGPRAARLPRVGQTIKVLIKLQRLALALFQRVPLEPLLTH